MKLITTEKAVRLIELNNTLVFEVDKRKNKTEIKKEIEEMFKIKINSIKSLIKDNKKIAYVRLNKENPAIDIATKLGMI
jgi:large subunit ribosomal protein L23Ae